MLACHPPGILLSMSDVTQILSAIEGGDPQAAEKLLPLVYDELRKLAAAKMANEKPGQTLSATSLVHEAYLRLVDVDKVQKWDSRGHFFAAAGEAMRRILVEQARRKERLKRGGAQQRVPLEEVAIVSHWPPDELLAIDHAITKLESKEPVKAKVVELRIFVGMNHDEIANVLGISAVTVRRHWRYARAWLRRELQSVSDDSTPEDEI